MEAGEQVQSKVRRARAQAKTVVFLSTCKQVKFAYEAMRRLRPGAPLRCLHGGMKQLKRMAAFYDFSQARLKFS